MAHTQTYLTKSQGSSCRWNWAYLGRKDVLRNLGRNALGSAMGHNEVHVVAYTIAIAAIILRDTL